MRQWRFLALPVKQWWSPFFMWHKVEQTMASAKRPWPLRCSFRRKGCCYFCSSAQLQRCDFRNRFSKGLSPLTSLQHSSKLWGCRSVVVCNYLETDDNFDVVLIFFNRDVDICGKFSVYFQNTFESVRLRDICPSIRSERRLTLSCTAFSRKKTWDTFFQQIKIFRTRQGTLNHSHSTVIYHIKSTSLSEFCSRCQGSVRPCTKLARCSLKSVF